MTDNEYLDENHRRQMVAGMNAARRKEYEDNIQAVIDAITQRRAEEGTQHSRSAMMNARKRSDAKADAPLYRTLQDIAMERAAAMPQRAERELSEAPEKSYSGALNALKYNLSPTLGLAQLAALPAMVYDIGEAGVDALRGTTSPSRFRQIANTVSTSLGGPSMPNTSEDWRGELAGNLLNPANVASVVGSPLRMLRSVPDALRHGAEGFANAVPVSNVFKQKGGNWLNGSVESALKGLKKPTPEWFGAEGVNPGMPTRDFTREDAINNFIDKQLTRYVKNEMATPEDPIRALAERGVLHVDPNTIPIRNLVHPSGEETRKLGVSEAAKRWENRSERAIAFNPASDYQDFGHSNMTREHPWVAKLDPTTPMYRYNTGISTQDLGFDHLIDELSNALNPESGLPQHLLLDPKSLDRVSVPQAVERVAKINEWRAAQKAEADAMRANNAATVLHKEYPETGMKWVELKKGKDLPEGWSEEFVDTDLGKLRKLRDPKTGGLTATDPREEALRDALKYEGDVMGHCVGGYCDDVASGRSRIYSLRDAKGQPHVTVEVAPGGKFQVPQNDIAEEAMRRASAELGEGADYEEVTALAEQLVPEVESQAKYALDRIVQIKGKANRAPNEEYLPFVQDFVRSGKWSDVGDLHNTGLVHNTGRRAEALGPYSTEEELTKYLDQFPEQNFAQGGAVQTNKNTTPPDYVQAIIALLSTEPAHG